ncbi:MAG: prepilin peptidase [Bacilli bacterium]|nr:prepilin peptidase [Bacilli bacterium]
MDIFIIIGLFIVGLIFGSFYLVVATRLPVGEKIGTSRSHCEYCKKELKWYELIPLFSYIIQLGKCRKCNKKLSIIYPATELITGVLFSTSFILYKFEYQFFISIILFSLLILIYISDFKYFIILDSPLVISAIGIFITYLVFFNINEALIRLVYGLFIFMFLLIIKLIGDKLFKRESLGGGDIKLGFIVGMSLGIPLGCTSLILSSFLALPYAITTIYYDEGREVPFGPFIISATIIIFLFMAKFNNLIDFLLF